MTLYQCHSDTTKCALISESDKIPPYYLPWKIQRGEIYATECDDFPKDGIVKLTLTNRSKYSMLKRTLSIVEIKVNALTFKRCFEKAGKPWELVND